MCVCLVAQSCLTLWTPWTVAHQPPLFMGILQARILEWVAMLFSRGSSQLRHQTQVSCFAGRFSTLWATSSVQFNCSVVSDSATPWTATHQASLSITNSWILLNSCPLSWWCYPTISSSVVPFSSCLKSVPASVSFQMSQFFASGGQSIGVSASASVLPMNIQDWFFRIDWLTLFAVQGTLKSLLQYHSSKASILWRSAFFRVQLSHP